MLLASYAVISDTVVPTDLVDAEERPVTEKTMTWTSGGTEHKLTLQQADSESDADFAQRCKDALDAQQALFPPD